MNLCNRKQCITKKCFCNLPISLADHIELKCCRKSVYHVVCIIKHDKCPYCLRKFNDNTLKAIKMTQTKVLEKIDKKKEIEKKKSFLRKQINKKVQCMILFLNIQHKNSNVD